MSKKNILIIGSSRGLGKAILREIPGENDTVFAVSRTKIEENIFSPDRLIQIHQDLKDINDLKKIYDCVGNSPIDTLIYNAGVWENEKIETLSDQEVIDVMNVNLTSAILIIKNLLPNIRKSGKAKLIFIGSTTGLENVPTERLVYATAKFGLRSVAKRYRELLRPDKVGVTIINPGSIAADLDPAFKPDQVKKIYEDKRMPMSDIIDTIRWISDLSSGSCPTEINIPSMLDEDY